MPAQVSLGPPQTSTQGNRQLAQAVSPAWQVRVVGPLQLAVRQVQLQVHVIVPDAAPPLVLPVNAPPVTPIPPPIAARPPVVIGRTPPVLRAVLPVEVVVPPAG